MQYIPQPIIPPVGYNPIDEYKRQLDNQGEPGIDGGVIDEVVITPKPYQFDGINKVPKGLRDRLGRNFVDTNWIFNDNTGKDQYGDFLDRNPEFKNSKELAKYLYESNDASYPLNSADDKYHRLIKLGSKYPYKVKYDSTGTKRAYAKINDKNHNIYGNISNLEDLVAEIAHPYQYNFGTTPKWKYKPQQGERIFREGFWPSGDRRYHHVYDTPGYFEYETHEVIEPQLLDHIENGTPLKFMNKNEKKKNY